MTLRRRHGTAGLVLAIALAAVGGVGCGGGSGSAGGESGAPAGGSAAIAKADAAVVTYYYLPG